MNETLVYDAARDGTWFTTTNIASLAIAAGLLLMAVPTILMMRRQPQKRARGAIGLGLIALIAVGVLFGLPMLDKATADHANADATTIEGVIGSVTPKLITVGIMKVMVACGSSAACPGVAVGDRVRVEFIDDSGPETDALATHIWKRSR